MGAASANAGRDALLARWMAANPQARLSASGAGIPTPPSQLRALAKRELSSGYQLAVAAPPPQRQPWWLRAWRWLTDRWTELWRAAFGRAHLGRRGAVALGDLLLVASIAAVAFALWRLLGSLIVDRSQNAPSEALEPAVDPQALYAAACERSRAGEFAGGSRLLFAAAVGTLTQRGILPADRSATVGELRRALSRSDGALLGPFDAVCDAFVTGTYAERAIDASSWERARRGFLALGSAEPA